MPAVWPEDHQELGALRHAQLVNSTWETDARAACGRHLRAFIHSGGFTETGSGAALSVARTKETILSVSPALEIGSESLPANGSTLRPFARGGMTWQNNTTQTQDATFAGLPLGTTPFQITSANAGRLADVATGIDVIDKAGAAMRLQYEGRFGESTRLNSFSIKGSPPY